VRSADLAVDGKVQRHDIRNIGVVDAVVLSRLTSPSAPCPGDGGSVRSGTPPPQSDS
jgi:hypothetical protein